MFGGLNDLRDRLLVDLQTCGHHVIVASAPVAKATLWLTGVGKEIDCSAQHKLPALLADLPLACLDWPAAVQRTLMQMGYIRWANVHTCPETDLPVVSALIACVNWTRALVGIRIYCIPIRQLKIFRTALSLCPIVWLPKKSKGRCHACINRNQ